MGTSRGDSKSFRNAEITSSFSALTQQRLHAWQPNFTSSCTISFYSACGLVFIGLGYLLFSTSNNVRMVEYDYTDVVAEGSVGSFEFTVTKPMDPPIWVYYELSEFYQNHRKYKRSYSGEQLSRHASDDIALRTCRPNDVRSRGNRILYPCGLVPRSIFNDTFVIVRKTTWKKVPVNSDAATIAWPEDLTKFRNLDPEGLHRTGKDNQVAFDMWILERFPPVECEQVVFDESEEFKPIHVAKRMEQIPMGDGTMEEISIVDCTNYMREASCNFTRGGQPFECVGNYQLVKRTNWGVESGHLMVWMRIAGLPNFRKLLGKISEKLEKGTYKVYFENNFPVRKFSGRKKLILSTGSEWGGHRRDFVVSYVVTGGFCLMIGLWRYVRARVEHVHILSE